MRIYLKVTLVDRKMRSDNAASIINKSDMLQVLNLILYSHELPM